MSSGFIAAKIRAHTARKNGLPAKTPLRGEKKDYSSRRGEDGIKHRRKLRRGVEKVARRAARMTVEEGLAHAAEMEALARQEELDRLEAEEARRLARRARRAAKKKRTPVKPKRHQARRREGQAFEEDWEFYDHIPPEAEIVAVGLTEREAGGPPPTYLVTAAQLRQKYRELEGAFAAGQIDEETYHRLKLSFYRQSKRGTGIGAHLEAIEKEAARRKTTRKRRGPSKQQLERLALALWSLEFHWDEYRGPDRIEVGSIALRRFRETAERLGFTRAFAAEKRVQQEINQALLRQQKRAAPRKFKGPHAREIRKLYAQQLTDAQAPTIRRETHRAPEDPFADFMYHEGVDAFSRENPKKRRQKRRKKGKR
jgi:hypothetical protein